ncbi:CLUMA_CG018249, isoform A [Clunio marinus]|uniref:CLUMA_CG018249, isoform A n=1 Tax=Clunio marinus TaxID=568069 RepID=A0A1J1IYB5_9DIPT|nr:CLUMA_CG018249, isoform A [Clunio marinus]
MFRIIVLTIISFGVVTAWPSGKSSSTCNCVCGVRGRTQKIVGGSETHPNEYPWVAGLFKQNKLYCGATVISNKYLLTAAHCVSSFEPREIRAFVGGHNISRDYTEIKRIKKIIPHENFDIFTFNNDIALLELDTPLFYSSRVAPACLPSGEQEDFTDQLTLVAGWGRVSERSQTSQTLRSVIVPIWSQEECLMAGCARKSLPGIYTRVVNYLDWIQKKMKGECMCQPRNGQRTNFLEKLGEGEGLLHVVVINQITMSNFQPTVDSKYMNNSINVKLVSGFNYTDDNFRDGKFLFDSLFGLELEEELISNDATNTLKSCECECGQSKQEIRIVGGRPTGINQFPWVARLVYDGQFHCGGSLLTADYVLTAAHCVRRLKRSKIRVILGDHDQFVTSETEAIQRAVSAVIRHRNFDQNTYNHDIALLRLRKPVSFSKGIQPICLPREGIDPSGKLGTVVGWGRTAEGGSLPGILQHVNVPVLTLEQCRGMKYRASRITPNMLCAGGIKQKTDSCQGDSGGPLLVNNGEKYEIVGIVSWGVGCGRQGYPGVYTRVQRSFKLTLKLHLKLLKMKFLGIFVSMICAVFISNVECGSEFEGVYAPECEFGPFGIVMNTEGDCNLPCPGAEVKIQTKFDDTQEADVCCFSLLITSCWSYQGKVGKGKIQIYNGNRYTEAKSLKDNGTKTIFGLNRNRPPAHDTPASPCSCRCGERNDESRIVGGSTTGVNEFPWMARLSYFNRFYCGGMLINDRYVLTAAHCVKGFMWFMIKVTFGEHDRCDDSMRAETRFVLRAISQKFSYSNFDNDMALLRLNDRVPITDFIRPICLPTNKGEAYVGKTGLVTGWGTLKEDGKPSCTLQEVEVPILSNEECIGKTNYTAKMITNNMMCAGYPGVGQRDSCQGDSGGPLQVERDDKRYELVGIVSWGNGCARPAYPGVYTRVTRYLDWIHENSKDGCFCSQ